VVDVDDACLTCDVQCDEATGLFTVTLENCGTKDLDVVAEPAFSGRILAGNTEVITGVQGAPTPGAGLCGSGGGTELIINWTADVAEDQCNLFDRLEGTCSDECPGTPCTVEFDVVKICDSDRDGVEDVECDLESGDIASYLVTVNYDITGECGIYFELTDVNAGVSGLRVPADGCVEGSGSVEVYVEIEVPECELGQSGEVLMPNVASVEAICCDGESTGITEESNEANCCYECCEPDFEVEKICDSDQDLIEDTGCIQQGGTATAGYTIWVHNTGTCDLLFLLNDEQAGIVDLLVGPIPAGQSSDPIFGVEPVPVCLEPGQSIPMDENVACAVAFNLDGSEVLNPDGTVREECDSATCCYDCPGGEGCTPGFWKNHPDCWCDEIVLSDGTVVTIGEATLVSSVFTRLQSAPYDTLDTGDRKSDFDTDSLADSIRYRGGAELAGSTRNMLRHATAALLNACTSDVNYPISAAMVVDLVNFVLDEQDIGMIQNLHTLLADWNEDSPCPIDAHCIRHDDVINGD
jgi:hypothetical protein